MFLGSILMTVVVAVMLQAGSGDLAADWILIRWWDASPKSLDLLDNTPINCLVLPERVGSPGAGHASSMLVHLVN
jgi:hypothetical protein